MGRPLSLINWRGLGAKLSGAKRSPDEILDELEKHKFGYLFANANLVRLLARAQLQNPRKIKLREIISWVDLVDSELRDLIKQAFGCRIIDRYSAEELGPIAVQCPKYDHLHLISPYLYMEIVDENGDAVPAGQMGRIQLTSLWIRSMPLFRYQLGDLVVAGPPCKKVNWPTIEKVAGRVRDYITGPGGELRMARLPSTSIRNSPNFLDSRIYLFQDKAVLLAATARPSTQQEIAKFHEELVYAFYLEPGMSEVLFSNSGKWREIWKRRVFEQIDEPYSKKRIMELANLEDQEPG
jgi:phenylacetate-CoA ligase